MYSNVIVAPVYLDWLYPPTNGVRYEVMYTMTVDIPGEKMSVNLSRRFANKAEADMFVDWLNNQ